MTQHITIPSTWTPPKYRFGQLVKQGEIVGMEYYPLETNRTQYRNQHGKGWMYSVLPSPCSCDTETFGESSIKPLTPEELHALIALEIKSHATRVAALKEQLEQGGEYGKP